MRKNVRESRRRKNNYNSNSEKSEVMMRASAVNRPAIIENGKLKFVIMDAPTDSNISSYIEELKKHHVVTVVRACEPTYSTQPLVDAGISVEEMSFVDGSPPPKDIVDRWLDLVEAKLLKSSSKVGSSSNIPNGKLTANEEKDNNSGNGAIAVHCVAGLGRAPVLVAIALVDLGNADPDDAIDMIRKKRRGAINAKQLKYIQEYKKRPKGDKCTIL